MKEKYFIHVDMDAFFASVEQLDHPEWKGKPVIVGGLPGERRSVVSTASYEARKFGVHSAMPTFQAYKLCPQGIFTHGNYHRYSQISSFVMEILKQYTPDVTQLSIDEASMDITGTQMLFGPPQNLALKIKAEIFEKTCFKRLSCKTLLRSKQAKWFFLDKTRRRREFHAKFAAFQNLGNWKKDSRKNQKSRISLFQRTSRQTSELSKNYFWRWNWNIFVQHVARDSFGKSKTKQPFHKRRNNI